MQEGVLEAKDLGDGKLANLVRYHCKQPPASEQVRSHDAARFASESWICWHMIALHVWLIKHR